jgi:hypothetical protein
VEYWKDDSTIVNPAVALDPAGIHPCALDTDCLTDSKRELAEMLNTVQHHRRCRAGYCFKRDKKPETYIVDSTSLKKLGRRHKW